MVVARVHEDDVCLDVRSLFMLERVYEVFE